MIADLNAYHSFITSLKQQRCVSHLALLINRQKLTSWFSHRLPGSRKTFRT